MLKTLTAAAALFVAVVASAGILTNPGFESARSQTPTGWTPYGQYDYVITNTGLAHGGTNYFKVYQNFSGSVNYTGVQQDYITGPGATYAAGCYAYTAANDAIAGNNQAWLEISFRDSTANVLALYRSAVITTNSVVRRSFPTNAWAWLPVTNQYNPSTYQITNTTGVLLAPKGSYFMRCQIVFQGDVGKSGGSMYFDDVSLTQTSVGRYGNWNIVWSDEFNGSRINPNIWSFETGNNNGWGNSELEYYTSAPGNVFEGGGLLHIVALKQSVNGFNYTSARMKTEGLFSFTYGRLEWSAKLPQGLGFWPALWLLGTNISVSGIGWPGCGEIDVMENKGGALTNVAGSLHSGSDETAVYTFPNGDSVTNFHTYTLDWASNAILFYVDGHLYESQTGWGSSTTNAYPFPFNQPFFILMNLAVGGNYLDNPTTAAINANSTFPGDMQIDYVRLYNQTAPLMLSATQGLSSLVLSWPSNIVCHLQSLTDGNLADDNWADVPNAANPFTINPSNSYVFFRLKSP